VSSRVRSALQGEAPLSAAQLQLSAAETELDKHVVAGEWTPFHHVAGVEKSFRRGAGPARSEARAQRLH
jgi:hypothetical protein